ncbi:MAG: carbohydrate-binding domain-containing protein [Spirochaetales bacterium]|nr:carbohydrate-binding domain-containing protein [Spirochaetales bacterium]
MANRNRNRILVFIISLFLLVSCSMDIFAAGSTEATSGTNSMTYSNGISLELDGENLYPSTYDESDYTSWQTYDFGKEYVYNVETMSWEGDSPVEEGVLQDKTKAKNADTSINLANITENPVSIRLTGTNDSFKVVIDGNGQAVKLTLDNLSLTSADRAINIKNSSVSYVVLDGENSLETLINSEDKNVLKSAADLILDGSGSLSVVANSKNGIACDSVICFLGGDTTVTVADKTFYTNTDDSENPVVEETKGTAVKAYLGFVMLDGNLTIYANNSDTYYESKGIKVDGYDESEGIDESLSAGMGWIVIDGGKLTVVSQGKAISAGYDGDDGVPSSSANYPVPDVYINGGEISVTTLHAIREDSKNSDDGVSPEGIEAKNNMYITGGTIIINSTDDCINASNDIYISGGLIYACASDNDAIDAGATENQGALYISGGALIAMGSGQPESGLDCNSNSRFQYTGGIIISMGGGQSNVPQASGTTAYTASAGSVSSGTSYALVQDGKVVLAFKVPAGYRYGNSVLMGSGDLASGSATLISGASVQASDSFSGAIYYGTVSVSGGNTSSVTVSNTQSGGMGGPGGGFPGGRF